MKKVNDTQFQKLINSSLENYPTEQIIKNIKFYKPLINEGILYSLWLDKLNDELRKREVLNN
tara:strand:- start:195 stop:380 length:186 start_codon:yes stop_codon:yes gene_type:complete